MTRKHHTADWYEPPRDPGLGWPFTFAVVALVLAVWALPAVVVGLLCG